MQNLLTAKEAASYLGLKPNTLATWRSDKTQGRPAWVKVGGSIRYELSELRAWLEKNRHGEFDQGEIL